MLKLDNNLLQEIGLGGLPEDQKKAMLQHIYETLELRVGTQLANQMTDKQLEEFEKFIDAGGDNNQAEALKWLEMNLPNYKQVVNDVFEALKGEIKQTAPQIMASAPAAAQPVSGLDNTQLASQSQPMPPTTPVDQPMSQAQQPYVPPQTYAQAPPQQAPQAYPPQPQPPQQAQPQMSQDNPGQTQRWGQPQQPPTSPQPAVDDPTQQQWQQPPQSL